MTPFTVVLTLAKGPPSTLPDLLNVHWFLIIITGIAVVISAGVSTTVLALL